MELPAIISALKQYRSNYRYTELIKQIYNNATVNIKLHESTNEYRVECGIRQAKTNLLRKIEKGELLILTVNI